ncbi:MAG: prolipoprotein diacylglyceryl transferase family protein, partial [Blastocatellia bacterium]
MSDDSLSMLARPQIQLMGRQKPAFQVLGLSGLGAATTLALMLTRHRGLSLSAMACLAATAIATFLALVMVTKIITGQETIVYYHHEMAVILTTALLLWLIHQPILPYLDITIIGVGLFLAFGRIGCFMVGCCHGRPSRKGVCYGQAHVDAGFPAYLAGVHLFPIQLAESAWVLLITAIGTAIIWNGWPAGSAFAWYVISYD